MVTYRYGSQKTMSNCWHKGVPEQCETWLDQTNAYQVWVDALSSTAHGRTKKRNRTSMIGPHLLYDQVRISMSCSEQRNGILQHVTHFLNMFTFIFTLLMQKSKGRTGCDYDHCGFTTGFRWFSSRLKKCPAKQQLTISEIYSKSIKHIMGPYIVVQSMNKQSPLIIIWNPSISHGSI